MSRVVDLVGALTDVDTVDYVERIYGSGHDRYCDYRPSVTAKGLVYCDTCGSQINNLSPEKWLFSFANWDPRYDALGPGILGGFDGIELGRSRRGR